MIEFLTFQTLILVLLKYFYNVDVVNLHLLTLIVLFGGFYFTYVKGFMVVMNYDITGILLQLSNIVFHFVPFWLIWTRYELNKNKYFETILLVLIYKLIFKPTKVYYIRPKEYAKLIILFSILSASFYILA